MYSVQSQQDIPEVYEASIFRMALLAHCFLAGNLPGLFSDPEDGGQIFLRNFD
jgi:hypothetical protein